MARDLANTFVELEINFPHMGYVDIDTFGYFMPQNELGDDLDEAVEHGIIDDLEDLLGIDLCE